MSLYPGLTVINERHGWSLGRWGTLFSLMLTM